MPEKEKINYGIRPLKKNERRPTQQEAIKAKAVRYYGKHKLNLEILKEYLNKKDNKNDNNKLKDDIFKYRIKMESLVQKLMSENNTSKEKTNIRNKIKNAYTRYYNATKTLNDEQNKETPQKKTLDELITVISNVINSRRKERQNKILNK